MSTAVDEAIEAWTDLAAWWVPAWSAQAKKAAEATTPAEQTKAGQDGVALLITSGIKTASTFLEAVTILVKLGAPHTVMEKFVTPSSQGARSLQLVGDMTDDSGAKLLAGEVTVLPAVLPDGKSDFTVSCQLGNHSTGVYTGTVRVCSSGTGALVEDVPVFLVI